MSSVLQKWVEDLPLRAQGTLLTAVRGCDDEAKRWTVHFAIKADCSRCLESYSQRHDNPEYIPNFGTVEAGDWMHPCTAEHDWSYCQAAKIHEALRALAASVSLPVKEGV